MMTLTRVKKNKLEQKMTHGSLLSMPCTPVMPQILI